VINGGKYLQWSYDNNPGTKMADNHSMTLDAPVINSLGNFDMCNNNIKTVGMFSRMLSATSVDQPIIQVGTEVVSGASGSVAVTLPVAYTTVGTYVAFISMEDTIPAETSVTRDTDSQITLYWNSGGSGSHTLAWQTLGT
jgi:hypothetical protein